MTAADGCPLCGHGLAATLGLWLRCATCCTSFDRSGHAYDVQWRPVDWRLT